MTMMRGKPNRAVWLVTVVFYLSLLGSPHVALGSHPHRSKDGFRRSALVDIHTDIRGQTTQNALLPESARVLSKLRGGEEAAKKLPPLANAIFQFWAPVCIFRGLMLAIFPKFSSSIIYDMQDGDYEDDEVPPPEEGESTPRSMGIRRSFDLDLARGIGCVLLGQGIMVLLVTTDYFPVSVQQAIGIGLLVRLLFLYEYLWSTRKQVEHKNNKFLMSNTGVMSWATASMLTGLGNPVSAVTSFASASTVKSGLLTTKPSVAAKRFYGQIIDPVDDSNEEGGNTSEKTYGMCRALGMNILFSASYISALAYGMDPMKATRLSWLAWSGLFLEESFIAKLHKKSGLGFEKQGTRMLEMGLVALGVWLENNMGGGEGGGGAAE